MSADLSQDYGFVLNFNDLSEELLDDKFEEWLQFMEANEPYLFDKKNKEYKTEEELRSDFEYDVRGHFPIYF